MHEAVAKCMTEQPGETGVAGGMGLSDTIDFREAIVRVRLVIRFSLPRFLLRNRGGKFMADFGPFVGRFRTGRRCNQWLPGVGN